MNIEYQNTAEDLLHLNLYHFQQSPVYRRKRVLYQFSFPVILVVGVLILVLIPSINVSPLLILPIGFVVVFWIVYMPRVLRRNVTKQVEKMYLEGRVDNTICKHKLLLTPETITDKTDFGKIETPWSDVQRIVMTDRYVYIYISEILAHIVPRNIFSSDEKCKEFIETIKRYCERARN